VIFMARCSKNRVVGLIFMARPGAALRGIWEAAACPRPLPDRALIFSGSRLPSVFPQPPRGNQVPRWGTLMDMRQPLRTRSL
jgi:hypothetical protein